MGKKKHMGFILATEGKKVIKTCNTTKKNSQHLATDWLWVAETHEEPDNNFRSFYLGKHMSGLICTLYFGS